MTQATMPDAINNPKLVARFEARRAEFLRTLRRLKRNDAIDEEHVEHILSELHKLSGVASLFGAMQLGAYASDYQTKLRTVGAAQRPKILQEMLDTFVDDDKV